MYLILLAVLYPFLAGVFGTEIPRHGKAFAGTGSSVGEGGESVKYQGPESQNHATKTPVHDPCLYPRTGTGSSIGGLPDRRFPNKTDRIVIIGAGPSGVHMAYKLKTLGFHNITIFEKSNRIGGKSYSIRHRGSIHEMGTTYTSQEYTEVFQLLKDFNAGSIIYADRGNKWISPNTGFSSFEYIMHVVATEFGITYPTETNKAVADAIRNSFEYIMHVVATEFGITDPTEAKKAVADAIRKYIVLRNSLFTHREIEVGPRPSSHALYETRGTLTEFLERNNITILKPLLWGLETIQGYGNPDSIPALYGLIWCTPVVMNFSLENSTLGGGMLEKGFQNLWETIVRESGINVVFNVVVKEIRRGRNISIKYVTQNLNVLKASDFDFLILAANVRDILPIIVDASGSELCIFSKQEPFYFTTTLFDSGYGRRSSIPTDYFMYNALSRNDDSVWVSIDSYATLKGFSGLNYASGIYPGDDDGNFIQSTVLYQRSQHHPDIKELDAKFRNHLSRFGFGNNYTVIDQVIWKAFPKFTPKDMSSGILWDIQDLQGYRSTWYIGSSATFDSVKSVVEYNKGILRKFNLMV